MKLYKPQDSEHWLCEIQTEAGDRKSINTFCQTKQEAEIVVAIAKLEEIEKQAIATRLTAEAVTLITANRKITVADALAEWKDHFKKRSWSERTSQNNLGVVSQWMSEEGVDMLSIGSITDAEIGVWINNPDSTSKRGTRQFKLSCLRNFFRFAVEKRYILANPANLVDVSLHCLSHKQKETEHKKVFTDEEYMKVYLQSSGALGVHPVVTSKFIRHAILLGRETGLRLGDICNLEWDSLDFEARTITVWMRKPGKRVQLPMSNAVHATFFGARPGARKFVFPLEQVIINDPKRRAILSLIFSRYFKLCGFPGYSFHSLRATAATDLALKGATMTEIATYLGHTNTSTTLAYVRNPDSAVVASR